MCSCMICLIKYPICDTCKNHIVKPSTSPELKMLNPIAQFDHIKEAQ